MKLIGIIVSAVLLMILLISSILANKKNKSNYASLNRKKHPLVFLYPTAQYIYEWRKAKVKENSAVHNLYRYRKKIKAVEINNNIDKYIELIWYKNFSYIFISIVISLLCVIFINIAIAENEFITKLSRQDFGGKNSIYSLDVIGLADETQTIQLEINERKFNESEIDKLFAQICEELPDLILNNNKSLDSVNSDLYLPEKWKETGILINWCSSDTRLIDNRGKVYVKNADIQGKKVSLTALISYMEYSCENQIDIRIMPELKNSNRYIVSDFSEYVKELEGSSREDEELILPETYMGRNIKYKLHKDSKVYYLLPVLVLIIGILKVLSEKDNIDKKWHKRNVQMIIDYSEIVSKLSVLVSAGLTVRSAWERISREYEKDKLNNKFFRYAYEEMLVAQRRLEGGISEVYAYEEFGQSCGIHSYIKLGNLLSQSVRKGYKGLSEILQKEAIDSFEERKNIAKRQGEEAEVKLLLPMIILFLIVLVILVFPAFTSI